jgi:hypothetical protein
MARVKPPKSTRAKKSRRDKQADAKVESPRKNARTDLEPANEPVPALKLSSAYTDSRPDAHEQSRADGEGDSQRKLSRKERRRLRRAA